MQWCVAVCSAIRSRHSALTIPKISSTWSNSRKSWSGKQKLKHCSRSCMQYALLYVRELVNWWENVHLVLGGSVPCQWSIACQRWEDTSSTCEDMMRSQTLSLINTHNSIQFNSIILKTLNCTMRGGDWNCRTGNCRIGKWRTKVQGWKMQDWKMKDKSAGLENSGQENDGQICRGGKCRTGNWRTKTTGVENDGHSIKG